MAAHLDVQPLCQLGRQQLLVDEHAQHRHDQRHQQRGRTAFPGDVAQREDDATVGTQQHVVEIATNGVRRPCDAEGFDSRGGVDLARQHGLLNLARHFEVFLQRQPIGDLQQDQQVEDEEAAGQPHRAVVPPEAQEPASTGPTG